jgi:iron complex outermembrane receptor protein
MEGDLENTQGALNVKWDLPWFSLKSITGLQDHNLSNKWDSDGMAADVVFFRTRTASSTAFSQEFNLIGSNQWINWLAGSHVMSEHFSSNFAPIFLPRHAFGVGLTAGALGTEKADSYSFFGDATVNLPWKFKAFGGLRWTHDKKITVQTVYLRAGSGLIPSMGPVVPSAAGTCENIKFKDTFTNLSPRYGLSWEPTEDINLYAKESFGYNAGGHYFNGCNNGYKAETLDTIEVGAKTRWFEGRLVANISLFANEFKDFQVFKVIGSSSLVQNAPLAKMQGAEFEFTAIPLEQLTINGGLSLLRSYYVTFEDIDVANPNAGTQNLHGNQLNSAPNYTFNLGAEYAYPLPGQWPRFGSIALNTLRLRGEWYLTDYIIFRPYNGTGYGGAEDRQKGYQLFNLYTTLSSPGDKYELRFFVKNLTNTEYYGYKIAAAWGQRLGVGAMPRWFGVEITASF